MKPAEVSNGNRSRVPWSILVSILLAVLVIMAGIVWGSISTRASVSDRLSNYVTITDAKSGIYSPYHADQKFILAELVALRKDVEKLSEKVDKLLEK